MTKAQQYCRQLWYSDGPVGLAIHVRWNEPRSCQCESDTRYVDGSMPTQGYYWKKPKISIDGGSVDSCLWMKVHKQETVSYGQSYSFIICDSACRAETVLAITVRRLEKELKIIITLRNYGNSCTKLQKIWSFWFAQTPKQNETKTSFPEKLGIELWKLIPNLILSDFVLRLLCSNHYSFYFNYIKLSKDFFRFSFFYEHIKMRNINLLLTCYKCYRRLHLTTNSFWFLLSLISLLNPLHKQQEIQNSFWPKVTDSFKFEENETLIS